MSGAGRTVIWLGTPTISVCGLTYFEKGPTEEAQSKGLDMGGSLG